MPAKVCPRCGAQYANLRSATCPQCFAKLVTVDEATAEELAQARAAVEQTPEFQQAKAEDDERFREQSFGACLGVIGITLVTVVLVIVLITVAAHRRMAHSIKTPLAAAPVLPVSSNPLAQSLLPAPGATIDDVMPPKLAGLPPFSRILFDQTTLLPRTQTAVYHAVYRVSHPDETTDVYAIPADRPESEISDFRAGIAFAAELGTTPGSPRTVEIVATQHWLYGVVGPIDPNNAADADEFVSALTLHFQTQEK